MIAFGRRSKTLLFLRNLVDRPDPVVLLSVVKVQLSGASENRSFQPAHYRGPMLPV